MWLFCLDKTRTILDSFPIFYLNDLRNYFLFRSQWMWYRTTLSKWSNLRKHNWKFQMRLSSRVHRRFFNEAVQRYVKHNLILHEFYFTKSRVVAFSIFLIILWTLFNRDAFDNNISVLLCGLSPQSLIGRYCLRGLTCVICNTKDKLLRYKSQWNQWPYPLMTVFINTVTASACLTALMKTVLFSDYNS